MKDNPQADYYLKLSQADYGNLRTTLERILDPDTARFCDSPPFGRFELTMPPTLKEGVGKYVYVRFVPSSHETDSDLDLGYATNKAAYEAALDCLIDNSLIVEEPSAFELALLLRQKG
jgi:hypothetical protein